MCGIFGLWNVDHKPVEFSIPQQATALLRHRGPDDEGYLFLNTKSGYYDERLEHPVEMQYNLAFGFRRLAILDLSSAGHQPMSSADGFFWIVFNGEIYNYLELRAELAAKGYIFKTATDTEVILAAYAEWGEACVEHFNGMWAFALWNKPQRRLFCARDRFGIKPFYYYWDQTTFAFASEIKALLQLPQLTRRPNGTVIYDYLDRGLLDHTSETFFEGINQLPAAHYLTLQNSQLKISRYWHLDPTHHTALSGNETVYAEKFYTLLEDAVRLHLRSDVAIGTCLSGGLDSSAIVCIANKLLFADQVISPNLIGQQQKTFSSCFKDEHFDERKYIEVVLAATGAEANYTFPSGQQLLEELPQLIWYQDEPFRSTSIYAQWCVMKLVAQRGVKVLLDGQGSDELLAGYHFYFDYYWGTLAGQGRWPQLWHELRAYQTLFGSSLLYLTGRVLHPYAPNSLLRLARRLQRGGTLGLHPDFAQTFQHRNHDSNGLGHASFQHLLYTTLTQTILPGLLHYEDRNSMAHSVEARVPFLDYRLVEFIFSLPADQKIKNGFTKAVMRNALQGILPEFIRTRTDKMGFVTPEKVWLATVLKDWIQEIISSQSFRQRGYFDIPQITAALKAHQANKRDLSSLAWRWVNLELWLRQMVDRASQ